jgi:hypothetical protein
MSNPDKIFKDKLIDHETPLGGRTSFEKVMAMRNKEYTPVWWKPALLVLCTLSAVSVTGYFMFQQNNGTLPAASSQGEGKASIEQQQDNANSGRSLNGNDQQATSDPDNNTGTLDVLRNTENASAAYGRKRSGNTGQNPIASETDNTGSSIVYIDASGLQGFGIVPVWNKFELGAAPNRLKLAHKLKREPEVKHWPAIELMMATGSSNIRDFDAGNAYSVRGNHRFGQYSAIALWDAGNGIQLGTGIGYSQFAGNGEWRSQNPITTQKITSDTVVIVQPGFPDKTVITFDTTTVTETEIKTGELQYKMSKVSIPLAFRYNIGQGRTLIRLSANIAPGMLTTTSGSLFNRESSMQMDQNRSFTMDARLGVGLYYLMSKRTAIIIEPGASYQSVLSNGWSPYSRIGLGMGFGLVIKL